METRKLECFVTIVDQGSITRAAGVLHMAQPALSQQVASLEAELKQTLLIRSKQGVRPTAAGSTLYRHAMTILPMIERTREAVASSGEAPSGRVSIGIAPYSMAAMLVPDIIAAVHARYPGILLHLTEIHGGVLSEAVRNRLLDIALVYEPGEVSGIHFTTVRTEALSLIGPRDTLEGRDEVTFEELTTLPLLLPERNHTIRQLLDAEAERTGRQLTVRAEVESVSVLARMVDIGLGYTVMPRSAALTHLAGVDCHMARLVNPTIGTRFALCTADGDPLSDAVAAVLATIREHFSQPLTRNETQSKRQK